MTQTPMPTTVLTQSDYYIAGHKSRRRGLRSGAKMVAITAMMLLFACSLNAVPAPTTWPASIDPPSAVYGWTARDALDNPATQPSTPTPTPPATQPATAPVTQPTTAPTTQPPLGPPAPGEDLAKWLAAMKPGTPGNRILYVLPPNKYYRSGAATVTPKWVWVKAPGSNLAMTSAGSITTANNLIAQDGFVISNFASIQVTGVGLDVVGSFVETEFNTVKADRWAQTEADATNFVAYHERVDCGGICYSLTGDKFVIADVTGTALAEYVGRTQPKQRIDTKTGKLAISYRANGDVDRSVGGIVTGCTFVGVAEFAKQSFGSRWSDGLMFGPATVTIDGQVMSFPGNTLREFRAGELATDLPPGYKGSVGSGLKIIGNTFVSANPNNSPISIDLWGNDTIISGNTFMPAAVRGVSAIGSSSGYTATGNTVFIDPTKPGKLFSSTAISSGIGHDGGGNSVKTGN